MFSFNKTERILDKKRNALSVFQQVKKELEEFIEQAEQETEHRREQIREKEKELTLFKQDQNQVISRFEREVEEADRVISNLENLT